MRFREGLIAARAHILWIVLLALASAAILHMEDAAPQGSAELSATD